MKKVKTLREQAGISQEEMAKHLKISRPTYNKIEQGESEPNISQLKKISEILRVPTENLLQDILPTKKENFSEKKYQEILLNCIKYGADQDGKITKTKLAKLTYLLDFAWFYEHLKPVTGLHYRRIDQGPVPNVFFRTIDELFDNKSITIEYKGAAQMISANETPSKSELNSEELNLLQKICKKWQGKNTKEIVDFTHNQIPWAICHPNEIIPYELITQEDPDHVY